MNDGQAFGRPSLRQVPTLSGDDTVAAALRRVLDSGAPALPVVDRNGALVGIFGEREFITALFPGYLGQLTGAHFVRRSLDADLDRRAGCMADPISKYMYAEHIDVGDDFSDVELAEIFIHHRVLVIPVVSEDRGVVGIITRSDFFRAVAERLVSG